MWIFPLTGNSFTITGFIRLSLSITPYPGIAISHLPYLHFRIPLGKQQRGVKSGDRRSEPDAQFPNPIGRFMLGRFTDPLHTRRARPLSCDLFHLGRIDNARP
jgi:hypothetical protein